MLEESQADFLVESMRCRKKKFDHEKSEADLLIQASTACSAARQLLIHKTFTNSPALRCLINSCEGGLRATQNAHTKATQDSDWEEWICRIAKGDEASLGTLYDAAVEFVYSIALRITGCPAAAEEITENVFFQVWRTAASYDSTRGNPHTWLFMICRSQSISWLRSAETAVSYPDMDALTDACNDQDTDPQSLLMAIQKNTCLHLALQSLSNRDRQLLALAFFHDLTYSEIASVTKMPLGTVKTNIRRALQTLRSTFQLLETRGKHESL